jgi:uncharacterized protein YcbX
MVPIGRVAAQWKYPVKSLRGQAVERLHWDWRGVVGDRLHAVRTADDRLGSGKTTQRFRRLAGLLDFAAEALADEPPAVTGPDGRVLLAGDPALDQALSTALGQPVRLTREAEVSHFDAAPVHLVTTASMAWLQERLPDADVDARRFRPNLVIATDAPAFAEHAWTGRTLAIGDTVRLAVLERCERCVMVTLPQDDLAAEPRLLRLLGEERDAEFGVYARVVAPGETRRGDPVSLVPL